MSSCTIVVCDSCTEGLTACAFRSRKDAEKYFKKDVRLTVAGLEYKHIEHTLSRGSDYVEIHGSDSDIHYKWAIIESDFQ